MSPYGTAGAGLQPHAETLPMTHDDRIAAARAALAASLERLRARGIDPDEAFRQASANLRHWRNNPDRGSYAR